MNLDKVKATKAEAATYMETEITKVIKTFGKRDPGSEGEKKACEYMAEQLKEYGCNDVKVESFDLHPAAFMGWIYLTVSLILVAFGLYFVPSMYARIASLVLIVLGVFFMVGEFVLYRQVVDKMFPKKTSYNVTAVKKPTGEVKHRLFYNGHPDAACEWTFNYIGGGVMFIGHFLISIVGLLYLAGILVASFLIDDKILVRNLGLGALAFLPFWLCLYIMWNEKQVVDGANDNLTGCYMGIAVLKALKEQGIELENTEVGVIISGSEEAGLRGAKAWCKAHENDYKDAETYIVAFDTIHEGRFLMINDRDLNLTVPADKTISDMFKAAADKIGVTCNRGNVPLGATDSAAFNQGGFKATGITAMDHNLQDYYHTRKDTIGNLDLQGLADCFAVSVQLLEDIENTK